MEHPIMNVDDIGDAGTTTADFFGREVLVYRVGGTPRATANVCPHLGGPLESCGEELVCAWHGARFSLATGERLAGPAKEGSRLMHLPTKVIDNVLTYVWKD